MNPTTPQAEGSTHIGDFDTILQPGASHGAGEAATVNWAYGMPLSYVHEMASHWLGLYDQTLPSVPDGSTGGSNDSLGKNND
jgi:hypothetical protein